MDGLIIKKQWLDLIFQGRKTWEIRGSNTKKRGEIALIESGSGMVVGTCNIIGSRPVSMEEMKTHMDKHCLTGGADVSWYLTYSRPHAWELDNVWEIVPKKYTHPQGAVVWVKNVL